MCYVNSLQLRFKGSISMSRQTSYDITVGEVSGSVWVHDTTGFTSRTVRMKNAALLLSGPFLSILLLHDSFAKTFKEQVNLLAVTQHGHLPMPPMLARLLSRRA